MESVLKEKYTIWIQEEKFIKKQELKLSIYITGLVLGWGLPLMFVDNKMKLLWITPFFLLAYISVLIKLKKLNNHMLGLLREMVVIKNSLEVNDNNKEIVSIINGLELYYMSTKTFSTFERLMKK